MEKVSPLDALWKIFKGKVNDKNLDLDEITGENPKLVATLREAREIAETKAENRFKDNLYNQAKRSRDSKSTIARGKQRQQKVPTNNKKQMTIGDE